MSKWVLVTGGAGFLGVNLCAHLLKKGKRVLCIDNFCTSPVTNLAQFKGNPNFVFMNDDITTLKASSLDAYPLESIYNLACPASPPLYQSRPLQTLFANTLGVPNLLEIARAKKIPILHTSTSEVYGDPTVDEQSEDYWGNVNCFGPRSCYDEGKRVAETFCFEYKKQFDVDVRIVRIFNTYGPYLNPYDGRVVSNFIRQALNNEDITVYGDGMQTRSLCYVSDNIEAQFKLMEAEKTSLDAIPIYNVGNPNEMTMLELATKIIQLTNSRSKIVFNDLPKDDPKKRRPKITKIERDLKWTPTTSLEEGLAKTIQHFRTLADNPFTPQLKAQSEDPRLSLVSLCNNQTPTDNAAMDNAKNIISSGPSN